MKTKIVNSNQNAKEGVNIEKDSLQGYPVYPPEEDIYTQYLVEKEINPEDTSKTKALNNAYGRRNEKNFNEDMSGSDLDIPGAELDDDQENIGNEDEENNYYSLGGDDHDDLDETFGE